MAEHELQEILLKLRQSNNYTECSSLLSKAKTTLLKLKALLPQPNTPQSTVLLAREVFEYGALLSIRAKDPQAFTRYVHQLKPFYDLPPERLPDSMGDKNKITGLYLLLLLTQGDYAGFHTELEALEMRHEAADAVEADRYLGYPIKLERWLMEGTYDQVWKAIANREVPSEEYGIFSEILASQIRTEIANNSEQAYPYLPISSTKDLLFLESEGAVISFAQTRGWIVRDGRIYFPIQDSLSCAGQAGDDKEHSKLIIENTLSYARELETIV
ncbi:Putative Subunit of the 19S regulatory particle of the 26S proteasome lid [Blumeria hordei DH14]|uniref:Putative Subunit of the 19S regulatory particle of the 26S proteasome lid n=1 Tax=Blumeria graminis f. sp. hordei (strain DH14) TaxID=546991 RepID=N1JKV0_BLUG1|nr:Putative Subunit of the 19S regulatory particle of the 26S proteasome lid [Blumeria hordei DH14]